MRLNSGGCPLLGELPSPPSGKIGWPWTEESHQLHNTLPDGSLWPKIIIVTPSYNQGQFLEETIRSVLLQGYPHLEYIIIDGGSTDGSLEIIKKYEPWLTYWVSESDRGQSHAINKGFALSTGEIMAWINSDDYYASGAFQIVAIAFRSHPTSWIAGNCYTLEVNGSIGFGRRIRPKSVKERWMVDDPYPQPGVFWNRNIWNSCRGLDEKLHFSLDYELWMQFAQVQPFACWVDQYLAYARLHELSKTMTAPLRFTEETRIIHQRYYHRMVKGFMGKVKLWELRVKRLADNYWSSFCAFLPPMMLDSLIKLKHKILTLLFHKRYEK